MFKSAQPSGVTPVLITGAHLAAGAKEEMSLGRRVYQRLALMDPWVPATSAGMPI
jgi:hypothetical protein